MSAVNTETGEIVGVHPFLTDLPIFEAEVESIAESIREVGLLHPITLDTEGRLIGGRHRLAACEQAGIEPEFETYDGDPLAFILHDNATRKHQSAGQRAAEVALSLDAAKKRSDGRWEYGKVRDEMTESGQSRQRIRECGLILDHLGRDALIAVAQGDRTLNDAYTEAEQVRDRAAQKALAEKREAEAEAKAQRFLEAEAPDLAAEVGGKYDTYQEAEAVWRVKNREAAEALRKARADHEAAVRRLADYVRAFLSGIHTAAHLAEDPLREEVLDALPPHDRDKFLRIEKEATWPTTN